MDKIDELIQKGQTFNFRNNSHFSSHGLYSQASDDLLSWIAEVEDFIATNYGKDSSAFKLYESFDRRKMTGYEEDEFNEQMRILFGAVKACKSISPIQKAKTDDHPVISLIKHPLFWTVLVLAVGASFGLGSHFGSEKFDKEKNEYYQQNLKMTTDLNDLRKANAAKDSTINVLKKTVLTLRDSLGK